MAHGFLDYGTDQVYLFPPSPRDWLPEDHLAYQIIDVVSELDFGAFRAAHPRTGVGAPAYPLEMMVCALLYAWCRKVYSSRKVAALLRDDVGGRVVGGGHLPDHGTVNLFRLRHREALNGLFKQSVKLCMGAGMVGLAEAALDGSKIAASASKRKAMSYERMLSDESRIQAEIDGYFKRAAEEDAADDERFGAANEGPVVSDEIARRQSRLAKIREAKAAIEAEAKAAAERRRSERAAKEAASEGRRLPGPPPEIADAPAPTAQRCFTDPESRIMKGGNGSFVQGYNAQAMVDGACQVIVACALSSQAADVTHLPEMLDQTVENVGCAPGTLLADPGYYSAANDEAARKAGVLALIPPDRKRHGAPDEPVAEISGEELARLGASDRMRRRVSTQAGRDAYRRRKGIVEPVFGQIKGCAGHPGFLGFLRRGLEKCSAEWQWACASHNVLKYVRHKCAKPERDAPAPRVGKAQPDGIGIVQTTICFEGA
jgi:transposase